MPPSVCKKDTRTKVWQGSSFLPIQERTWANVFLGENEELWLAVAEAPSRDMLGASGGVVGQIRAEIGGAAAGGGFVRAVCGSLRVSEAKCETDGV